MSRRTAVGAFEGLNFADARGQDAAKRDNHRRRRFAQPALAVSGLN
jgi:hypothetical protein